MVYRRFGLLKYLTPCVAVASFVLGCSVRAAENTPAGNASAYLAADEDGMSWCRVSAEKVNMRVGPNTSTQIFSTLRSGEYIRAKSVQKDWLEMEWPKNIPAWVLKDTIASADGKSGTVRAARARIMGQGTNNSPEVAVLEHGARISIIRESGDWYQVQAPSAARAYISAKFVVVGVQAPADTVPLPPEPKYVAKVQREQPAEPVELPVSKRHQQETDATPADVVIVTQQQAAWPQSSASAREGFKHASVEVPGKVQPQPTPVAVSKTIDDSQFAPATTVALPPQKKVESDSLVARAAAAERKRLEDAEVARKESEVKRVEIEAQARDAADRKKTLEAEIVKLADARKKAEADEATRQVGEKKRLEEVEAARVAADERRKTDLIEQSRLASERKRLEDSEKERMAVESRKKVEIETQTQAISEKKKVLEVELARLSEAKKKAELDEQNRMSAEKKRLADAETARIAAETRKAELEEQALKAADKKKALEAEISQLAAAKKKEEQDATARAAREKKLIDDAELARKEIEARRKSEQEELAKKESDKKRLDAADTLRATADAKRRAELADQEKAALARKQVLEAEIARLHAEKLKYQQDAEARIAAERKDTEAAEIARAANAKKTQAEIDALTKLAAEKKRLADEEAARATAERKRADAAELARAAAEKKHAEEMAAAKQATERKQIEEEAARVASEHKRSEELAAQKAADRKREAEAAMNLAAAQKRAEDLAAKQATERKRAEEAEVARLAQVKRDAELEAARLTAENNKKVEQDKVRQENDRKLAELEQARVAGERAAAVANKTAARLPDLIGDDTIQASKSVALVTDKTIMLSESDLALEKGEPTERNYNSNYLPQSVVDIKKRYVVPPEVPKRAQIVAETIDIDLPVPAAKAAPMTPASKQLVPGNNGETVELAPKSIAVVKAPIGPTITHVTDSNFAAEIGDYKGAVLIDFHATWCGPCRRLGPTVDELAEQFRGKVKVVKIDVDQAPDAARRYGAYSIPMLVMIRDGKTLDSHVGAPSREYLQNWMQNNSDGPR